MLTFGNFVIQAFSENEGGLLVMNFKQFCTHILNKRNFINLKRALFFLDLIIELYCVFLIKCTLDYVFTGSEV